ncbi:CHAP domain-containing protein [Nonomuraea sp. NPDC049152]|uniref:CHAP domain-containing protein n=1 Tax=Nonomuraea sp. NPDC049152 TaxID=3154350 RepID=UPI0033C15B3E
MDPIAEGLLKAARPELGYREKGGQHTKFGTWYANLVQDPQYRDAPWCDMFIAWAAQKAGVQEFVGQFAWTPSHAAWFIQRGAWSQQPEPGALVFYDWKGGKSYKGIDHVGIVEKVAGSKIYTIEANVDRVWLKRKVRDTDKVVGYGLPRLVKERPTLIEVRPSDRPPEPFTVQADLPSAQAGGSPFDLLGTPQALLAAMVLTTVIVSFRVAGRSRGSGRHRRGLIPWITSTAQTAQTAGRIAPPSPPRTTSPSTSTPTRGASSGARSKARPGAPVTARATSPSTASRTRAAPPSTAPQTRVTPPARAASSPSSRATPPLSGATPPPSGARGTTAEGTAAKGGTWRTGGGPPRQPVPRTRVPADDTLPHARTQGDRAREPLERSGEHAQIGRASGSSRQPTPQPAGNTARRRKPYEATTGK